MVITTAQIQAWFKDKDGLVMKTEAREALKDKGIEGPDDLLEFNKESISQIASGFRKRTPVVPFSAKSQKRTVEAINLLRFYETTGRPFAPSAVKYLIIKDFVEQWKSLKNRMDHKPDVPKITKELGVLRWSEAFSNYLAQCIGVRGAPAQCSPHH